MIARSLIAFGLCIAVTQSTSCGIRYSSSSRSRSTRIIGGSQAAQGDFPWMASYQVRNASHLQWRHICGCSIISPYWLLLAAHCLSKIQYGNSQTVEASVLVGSLTRDNTLNYGQRYSVVKEVSYEYMAYKIMDVAVIRVAGPIDYHIGNGKGGGAVGSVCIASAQLTTGTVSGWGVGYSYGDSSHQNSAIVPGLQAVTIPILSRDTCKRVTNASLEYKADHELCAGYINRPVAGPCFEDSGSPLVYEIGGRVHQIGIVSRGTHDCRGPTIFTEVAAFYGWIMDVMATN